MSSSPSMQSTSTAEQALLAQVKSYIDKGIVNAKIFSRLVQQTRGDIGWLIDLYISEWPAYQKAIDSACEQRDVEALLQAVHKFKGGSANLGAAQLVTICEQIETHLKNANLDAALELHQELTEAGHQFKQALETINHA